ncbi:MAG: ATP-binding cassette domain-containing protein [Cyclobacteriaceae bacterium]|nr:ATP-binding cassette domain-containing protein [Cyclobacteriaceae bacterium]MDX5467795.1 ATP-binding cassette domain-containing protein [Cyclobacteriaceae bacterium]
MPVKPLFEIKSARVQQLGKQLFENLEFVWEEGEHWAILGNSSLELTGFLETLRGNTIVSAGEIQRHFASEFLNQQTSEGQIRSYRDLIAYVSQTYQLKNRSNLQNFYFQQRFNSSEADDAATVLEYIQENSSQIPGPWTLEKVAKLVRLEQLLESSILKLSNGETRRLALALGLMKQPRIFLMDQPMTGLDAESRKGFGDFLKTIIKSGIHVLITANSQEIPEGITHVAELGGKGILKTWKRKYYPADHTYTRQIPWDLSLLKTLVSPIQRAEQEVIRLVNVRIKYGDKTILNDLNWTVQAGEKWQLKGKNGSGKSTLISLLIGENPQAYSQNFWLFGRKRGTGESIWELKKPIGFVAPELVRFFPANQTVYKVIASGLFDTIGLYRKLTPDQESIVWDWIRVFQLDSVANLMISRAPLDKQRWALLARALVKNPKLLILDEASQGMDEFQRLIFKETIGKLIDYSGITLIFVSHYQEDAPESVDQILDLDQPTFSFLNKL